MLELMLLLPLFDGRNLDYQAEAGKSPKNLNGMIFVEKGIGNRDF